MTFRESRPRTGGGFFIEKVLTKYRVACYNGRVLHNRRESAERENMRNIVIIGRSESEEKPKHIYKVSEKYEESEMNLIESYTRDLLDEYEYAYIGGRQSVYGKQGKLLDSLESLVEKDNKTYLTEYTPEELFEEVADDWDSLAEYLFGSWADGKSLKKAYEYAQEHGADSEALAEILSLILGEKVSLHISRGYSQGDYAEAYIMAESEEELDYIGGLFDAWAFGVYDLAEYIDENDEEVALAIILNYTPEELIGKTWEAREKVYEAYILESVGLGEFVGKVGEALAKRTYSWHYNKTEAEEK